jgi:hypothetical protein
VKQTLIPSRAGSLKVPGFKIKASVVMPSQRSQQRRRGGAFDSFFDDFFNSSQNRMVRRAFSSKDQDLIVKALPTEGRPQNFRDVIGTFRIDSELSSTQLKAGDTTTLTITIDGVGSLDSMGSLDLQLGSNIRIYPDKPQIVEKATERHGLESKRTFRFALVPTQRGEIKLGQVKIPYFDLSTGSYKELIAELGTLNVAEGDSSTATAALAIASNTNTDIRKDVKALASDLIDLHRSINLKCDGTLTRKDFDLAALVMGIPGLLCFMFFVLQFFRKRKFSAKKSRRKTALKNFEKRLSELQAQSPGFLEASYSAYRSFLGDTFDIHGSALTAKEISVELSKLSIPKELLSEIETLALSMERAQYASESGQTHHVKTFVDQMKRLVREIEKQC